MTDWRVWLRIYRAKPEMCGVDERIGVMVHRFDTGAIVCRCGMLVVRQPVKKQRAGYFGRGFSDSPNDPTDK